jgi:PBP1b-binding outer membrane lipoprotein LpoB
MRYIILLLALFMVGCYGMSMKPHKTSVTYGKSYTDKSDEDKTDAQKDTFTITQHFIWE